MLLLQKQKNCLFLCPSYILNDRKTVDNFQKHITTNKVMMQSHICTAGTVSGYGIYRRLQKRGCNL